MFSTTADYDIHVFCGYVGKIKVYISLLIDYSLAEIVVIVAHNKPTLPWEGLTYNKFPIYITKKVNAYLTSQQWHTA